MYWFAYNSWHHRGYNLCMYKSILTHGVFFTFLECPIRSVTYHYGTNSPKKIKWGYTRLRGRHFCKMSRGLDNIMAWWDSKKQSFENAARKLKILLALKNTVKERAVVCRWCGCNAFNQIIIQPISIWREKFWTYFTRQNNFYHDFKFLTVFFNDFQYNLWQKKLKTKLKIWICRVK